MFTARGQGNLVGEIIPLIHEIFLIVQKEPFILFIGHCFNHSVHFLFKQEMNEGDGNDDSHLNLR
jgi:hypothetical protein